MIPYSSILAWRKSIFTTKQVRDSVPFLKCHSFFLHWRKLHLQGRLSRAIDRTYRNYSDVLDVWTVAEKIQTPILKDLVVVDILLIRTYRKLAATLRRKCDEKGYKRYIRKMFRTYEHLNFNQQEIEANANDARRAEGYRGVS